MGDLDALDLEPQICGLRCFRKVVLGGVQYVPSCSVQQEVLRAQVLVNRSQRRKQAGRQENFSLCGYEVESRRENKKWSEGVKKHTALCKDVLTVQKVDEVQRPQTHPKQRFIFSLFTGRLL